MPKNTIGLIIGLLILSGILVFVAIRKEAPAPPPVPRPVLKAAARPERKAQLYFIPSIIDASGALAVASAAAEESDVFANANGNPISLIQIELLYDPKVIKNVSVSPPDSIPFFPSGYKVVFRNIDAQNGRISYALTGDSGAPVQTGAGKVGRLSFTITKPYPATDSAEIIFLDKTFARGPGSETSVLGIPEPLRILLSESMPASSSAK